MKFIRRLVDLMLHWLSDVKTATPTVSRRERNMPLFYRNSVALYSIIKGKKMVRPAQLPFIVYG